MRELSARELSQVSGGQTEGPPSRRPRTGTMTLTEVFRMILGPGVGRSSGRGASGTW